MPAPPKMMTGQQMHVAGGLADVERIALEHAGAYFGLGRLVPREQKPGGPGHLYRFGADGFEYELNLRSTDAAGCVVSFHSSGAGAGSRTKAFLNDLAAALVDRGIDAQRVR